MSNTLSGWFRDQATNTTPWEQMISADLAELTLRKFSCLHKHSQKHGFHLPPHSPHSHSKATEHRISNNHVPNSTDHAHASSPRAFGRREGSDKKDPPPRDATTSDAAADRRIAPRSTGNGRGQGGQCKGRVPGVGGSPWGRRGRRRLGTWSPVPVAEWLDGIVAGGVEEAGDGATRNSGRRRRQAVRQVDGNESSSHTLERGP